MTQFEGESGAGAPQARPDRAGRERALKSLCVALMRLDRSELLTKVAADPQQWAKMHQLVTNWSDYHRLNLKLFGEVQARLEQGLARTGNVLHLLQPPSGDVPDVRAIAGTAGRSSERPSPE